MDDPRSQPDHGVMSGETTPVGIVTVSYHSTDVLGALLPSVRSQRARLVGIVADNADDPKTRALSAEAGFGYLALANPGYGAAVNAAVRTLASDVAWIVITNPDVVFEADTIDTLLAAASANPDAAAFGPRVLDEHGSVYPSARELPSLRTGIGHALFSRLWAGNPWTARYLRSNDLVSEEDRDAGWLSGSCLLVRRSAFDAVGGFDDRYFMYFEDVDLGLRFARAGWRSVYVPRARIRHTGGTSTRHHSAAMLRAHHRSAELFLALRYPGAMLTPLRLILSAGLRLRTRILIRSIDSDDRDRGASTPEKG